GLCPRRLEATEGQGVPRLADGADRALARGRCKKPRGARATRGAGMKSSVWGLALSIPLSLALFAGGPAPALAADLWRIENIPLDMPLDEDLNGEYLEGIFQEKIGDRLQEGLLTEWPI